MTAVLANSIQSKDRLVALTIRVDGLVQRVGFRRYLERIARQLKISGFVRNMNDGTVSIFAQGDPENIEAFVLQIKSAPKPILVERVDKTQSRPRPSFKNFHIRVGSLVTEFSEGFGAIESQFGDYREEFKDYRTEFRDFAKRTDDNFNTLTQKTDQNFKTLDVKYGEISAKLTQILEELRTENRDSINSLNKSVEALLQAVEKFSK